MSDESAPASVPARRVDRLTGKTIAGRYVVERLIARGGMAAVYQAHQVQLNRKVAIKVLRPPPDSEESAGFGERFRLEAETLAQLNHPNIVTVFDHGEFDHDQVFLTMEYVDGKRLTDLLRDGALPAETTLRLIFQVCEALRYAHRRGVVHRDLKPSNLLITQTDDDEQQVKVVDFGLVKLTEVDMSVTSAGLILGSPHCMAPEQVRGLSVDARTDIYAVGVLLFRCLTGHYPFHGANSTATMIAHLNQPTPSFFSVAPDLEAPEELEGVVRRCLAKQPAERFDSMEDLQQALAPFLGLSVDTFRTVTHSQSTLRRVPAPEPAATSNRSGLVLLAALAALALTSLVLCAGVWAWMGLGGTATVEPTVVAPPEIQLEPTEPKLEVVEPGVAKPGVVEPEPGTAAPQEPPKPQVAPPARVRSPVRAEAPVEPPEPEPEAEPEPEPKPEGVDIGKELAPDFDAW